jgi:hypothetical protein
MKIWMGYASEHSANLVMIGRFKDARSAEEAKRVIDEISQFIANREEDERNVDSYSDDALELLQKVRFHSVAPGELAQFAYEVHCERRDDKVVITTDEIDVSAFLKLMIDRGARVEVYSAHDYPEEGKSTAVD